MSYRLALAAVVTASAAAGVGLGLLGAALLRPLLLRPPRLPIAWEGVE